MGYILESLKKKYEGEIAVAKANVQVYIDNPAGIGEHPEVVQAIDTEIEKLAAADEKLEAIKRLFGDNDTHQQQLNG